MTAFDSQTGSLKGGGAHEFLKLQCRFQTLPFMLKGIGGIQLDPIVGGYAAMQKRLFWLIILVTFSRGLASGQSQSKGVPTFKFFRMRTGEGLVSLVVPVSTTDEQLVSLLQFIRAQVQNGHFTELGIRHPTDKRYGKLGYTAGIISVYRGERCANEQFIDDLGPCGYGEHDVASYQWGVGGDRKKDEALIRSSGGDLRKAF